MSLFCYDSFDWSFDLSTEGRVACIDVRHYDGVFFYLQMDEKIRLCMQIPELLIACHL